MADFYPSFFPAYLAEGLSAWFESLGVPGDVAGVTDCAAIIRVQREFGVTSPGQYVIGTNMGVPTVLEEITLEAEIAFADLTDVVVTLANLPVQLFHVSNDHKSI